MTGALPPVATEWRSPQQSDAEALPHVASHQVAKDADFTLDQAVTTVDALLRCQIEPRPVLMSPFIHEANLGFIYGVRGHGKTWVALFIATILSSKRKIGRWEAPDQVPTLLIDGEVDLDETQERLRLLEASGDSLFLLHHQNVYDRSNGTASLDLANPVQQEMVTEICKARGIKLLILDNLSTLLRGVSENDGDHWEPISHWLLDLRRQGVAVIIVHHAGRNGQMRGHSRREDPAHWIIKVEKTDSKGGDVTAFTTRFEKYRRVSTEAMPLHWEIVRMSADQITIKCEDASDLDVFVQHVMDGVESATEIAELMNVSKGQVCKLAKKAATAGLIKNMDGKYKSPSDGNETGNAQKQ